MYIYTVFQLKEVFRTGNYFGGGGVKKPCFARRCVCVCVCMHVCCLRENTKGNKVDMTFVHPSVEANINWTMYIYILFYPEMEHIE